MKKFHVLRILLIAVLTITALPMPAANEQQAQTKTFRQKATKRFNESVTRFKRCLNRECTKGELVKVGKELIAAIGTLIVVGGIGYLATTRKMQKPLAPIPSKLKVGDIVAVGTPPFDPDQEIDVFVISDVDPQTGRLLVSRYKDNQALPLSVETNEVVLPISDITKIKQGTYSFGVGSRYFITYEDLATTRKKPSTPSLTDAQGNLLSVGDIVTISTPAPGYSTPPNYKTDQYKIDKITPEWGMLDLTKGNEGFSYAAANVIKVEAP